MICMTQMIVIQMFLVIASPLEIEFLSKLSGPAPCLGADSWLELAMVEEDEETVLKKVEAKIAASTSTALKGIPSPVGETGGIEACQSALLLKRPLQ